MQYFSTLFGKELYIFRTDLLSTSLADSQHNYYEKYLLLWIQY
jgi:hypothetical protein